MFLRPPTGIHIEPTNICTLRCAGCPRTRFLAKWPAHWRNHSLDIKDLLDFLDIDLENLELTFCGNYGDPIYHPGFIDMIAKVKTKGAKVSIVTNGSHRRAQWWQQLCANLGTDDRIRFSIDGMPDSFTNYRENADWTSIETAIKTCVSASVPTIWKFIPFAFNEAEIESARALSQNLGMTDFMIDASDRFDEQTEHLVPVQSLLGARKKHQDQFKNHAVLPVDPKCRSGRQHFISATGYYSPCCYVADHRFYYKTPFGHNKTLYDIKTIRLSDLLQTDHVSAFFQSIDHDPPGVCQFNCPKI